MKQKRPELAFKVTARTKKISMQENYQCRLTKVDMVWKLGSDAKQLQSQKCQNEKVEAGDFDFW